MLFSITEAYQTAYDAFGPQLLYVLLSFLSTTVPFLALNVASDMLLQEGEGFNGAAMRFRILPGKKSDPELTRTARKEALIDHFLAKPLALYFGMYWLDLWINPRLMSTNLPSLTTVFVHLVLCMIIEDTSLYWLHRLFHHPSIYARVHKRHHDFHVTTGWAAAFGTSTESIVLFALPALLGVWLLRSHILTRAIYMAILVFDSFLGHAGFDFPYLPFFTSARRHNYHHSHNVGTYGLKFGFWDSIMKTDDAFRKWERRYEESRESFASSSSPSWLS